MVTTIYKLFGFIPLWSTSRKITPGETDELYQEMNKRFTGELKTTLDRLKAGK